MIFASLEVPSVTVANAWVSPRVKTEEPCVEGKIIYLTPNRTNICSLTTI